MLAATPPNPPRQSPSLTRHLRRSATCPTPPSNAPAQLIPAPLAQARQSTLEATHAAPSGTAAAGVPSCSVTITHSDGPMSDQCGNTGSFVRTWTATDACGNTAQSTQTITVVDTTAPTISDVPDAIVECTGSTDPSAIGASSAEHPGGYARSPQRDCSRWSPFLLCHDHAQ